MASLAENTSTETKTETTSVPKRKASTPLDIRKAARENEKEILAALTEDQKSKIPLLLAKLSAEQKSRWPVATQDMALYRFLEARKFDVEKAAEMLTNHLEWRAKTFPIKKEDWVNDPLFKSGAIIPNAGFDNGGRSILVLKSGRFPADDTGGEPFKYGTRKDL